MQVLGGAHPAGGPCPHLKGTTGVKRSNATAVACCWKLPFSMASWMPRNLQARGVAELKRSRLCPQRDNRPCRAVLSYSSSQHCTKPLGSRPSGSRQLHWPVCWTHANPHRMDSFAWPVTQHQHTERFSVC